jgi:hypothetical protein
LILPPRAIAQNTRRSRKVYYRKAYHCLSYRVLPYASVYLN